MFVIEVSIPNLQEVGEYFVRMSTRLINDRPTGLFKAVNRIADVWSDNFRSEGARVGGWDELAESTQKKRAAQGFNPSSPILERSGALRDVAVDRFTRVRSNGTYDKGDNYSGHTTTSTISVRDGVATLQARGWKVLNQYDEGHPARPIWFVDRTVLFAAQSGVVDWLINDVIDE